MLGPPPTSGTRDAFVELVMDKGCEEFPDDQGAGRRRQEGGLPADPRGRRLRRGRRERQPDRAEAGRQSARRFGIFGYSLPRPERRQAAGRRRSTASTPTFETIADGTYPVSRPLYFYVKNAHVGVIPGIKEFVAEFTSEKAMGADGYLADKGLIPLPDDERKQIAGRGRRSLTPMTQPNRGRRSAAAAAGISAFALWRLRHRLALPPWQS